jgi:hypothetical protein
MNSFLSNKYSAKTSFRIHNTGLNGTKKNTQPLLLLKFAVNTGIRRHFTTVLCPSPRRFMEKKIGMTDMGSGSADVKFQNLAISHTCRVYCL